MTSPDGLIVVALGGNAISPSHSEGSIPEQFAASRATATRLADLVVAGRRLIITHGNGPQVGNVLRRVELAAHEIYRLPLDTCVADTQAGMGYMIGQCLGNELRRRGLDRVVSTLVTSVEVDRLDEAFKTPSKPIGGYYSAARAAELRAQYAWPMIEFPGKGWRRVVPSPKPSRIVEIELIRRLARDGELCIVCGGGGIPVVRSAEGEITGIEAVIDKDRTSALLAGDIDASLFVIATEVRKVFVHFGKPDERALDRMSIADARRYLAAGEFPAGSMGPKVEAAIDFLTRSKNGQARVMICHLDHLLDALGGADGTWIER